MKYSALYHFLKITRAENVHETILHFLHLRDIYIHHPNGKCKMKSMHIPKTNTYEKHKSPYKRKKSRKEN
jgi:hypothetical protein